MFARHLNTVGLNWLPPAQTFLGNWRHFYQPGHSWWTIRPALQPEPSCSSRFLSGIFRPPEPHHGYWTRRVAAPGFFFNGCLRERFHQSSGLMHHSDKEPPPKRRKSSDDRSPHKQSQQHMPRHSPPPRESRSSTGSPPRFRNVSRSPPSHRNSPLNLQRAGPTLELKRQWENFSHCYSSRPQPGDQPFDFSVMSYNILSQELLHDNAYLYKHCQLPILDWGHRFHNIIRELEEHNADILCLQEVQEDHYEKQIKPSLEALGYHCEYKRRTGRKPDGCAVVFKRDRFSLVSAHPVEYFRPGVPLLDRDNVGLVLLLRPAQPPGTAGSDVCVANTHLLYNPRRGDIKLAQLAMLLAEIGRVALQPDGATCPIVLCGDFNSVPCSPLYNFIKHNKLEYGGMAIGKVSGQEDSPRGQRLLTVPIWPGSLGISQQCQYECPSKELDAREFEQQALAALNSVTRPSIEHSLKLTSAYSHYLRGSEWPEITTCHSRTAITVDYIFYSAARGDVSTQPECSAWSERGLQLLARLELVGEMELQAVSGLPNEHHSSDHLPLLAHFRLQPGTTG